MKKIFIDRNNIDHSLIKMAAQIIQNGGIVALPTETVYGLSGCVSRKDAVDRLYTIKNRPKDKPFSFVLDSIDKVINNYFDILPPFGYRLMEKFWPGPLTIVHYTPENKKIGVRVPSNVIVAEILRELKEAVYLPSANISGEKESASASEVEAVFNEKIDLIVDGGDCFYSQPSTVVDLTYKPFKVSRSGVISEKDIAAAFIRKRILFVCTGNSCRSPMAQFLLEKYLNQTKLYFRNRYEVISRGISAFDGSRAASHVVDILKEKEGLDANAFSAQRLNRDTILSSDFIFTMEDAQSKYILKIEPSAEGRIFNLKKFLPPKLEKDIPDPIGKGITFYEKVYFLIKGAILELIDWL